MSAPLRSVARAAAQARSAWRRSRAVTAAGYGVVAGCVGATGHAVVLEATAPAGFEPAHFGGLALWIAPAVVAGIAGWLARPTEAAAAAELDARLGFADRLGTALEFADADPSLPLVAAQRADAGAFAAGADAAAAFPAPWRRLAPLLVGGLVLFLGVVGATLTFQWTPAPEPTALASAADDLLAAIDRDRTERIEVGDREAVRLLNDLEKRIRRITAREETVRKKLERSPSPPPATTDDPPDLELPPPPPRAESTGISVEDLEALEEATLDQLELTDNMEAEVVSELFRDTQAAQKLVEEFGHLDHAEMEAAHASEDASHFGRETAMERATQALQNEDLLGNNLVNNDSLNSTQDRVGDNMDMIRRDLSAESLGEHDRGHDTQESFNRFLKDFVKDLQGVVAEKALGKKQKKKREVKTNTGNATADKRDAMSESGFEEMDGPKRSEASAPPETVPGKGKPPKNAKMQQGKAGDDAIAMKGQGDGGTSAGAKGAGSGSAGKDGLRALIPPPGSAQGPLEEVLGSLAQGRMPAEQRDRMFDRMARHKVEAGLASEADDLMFDYFAEAEALIATHDDYLPPLFRDYAHSYFEAIRPGTD